MNQNVKWSHLPSFYLFFCLKVLTLGSAFFLEERLEPTHQHKDIRTYKKPASFEDHFYLVLMNLCLAFFLVLIFQFLGYLQK